jgi:hypothetical protein
MSYENSLADEILKHHDDSVRAQTLAALSDEDMQVLGVLAKGMSERRDGCRSIGRVLEGIWCQETHRRGSGGRVEVGSYTLPNYFPAELLDANSVATAMTYGSYSQQLGVLFDEIAGQLQNQINVCLMLMQRHIEKSSTRGE